MSHILVVGCGPAGISAALRLAERGQKVTLAAAKPPIYHRCVGLPGIDLPEETAQELRAMGAQSLSGHEVMHALSRRLLRFESDETIRFLPYHRLVQLAVGGGRCVGGVLLSEHAGTLEGVAADGVLLATGGMHTMFSENRFGCDGLAATLAFQAGAALRNPDQINTGGRCPIFEGGLITSWDGETTVPGLYAAGECADGTALAFPFSQALATGTAAADYLCESRPETDSLEAGCAVTTAVNSVQQLLDVFRKTRGTRAPAAVERRIRETVQRTMTGGRTARLLQRGLLDIRVMRQQAGRGGYDLGEGLYPAMRLPALLQLLEVMLTTAAYRLLRQDGDLTAVLKNGKIEVTAKRSAAVEAAAYTPEDMKFPNMGEPAEPQNAAQVHPKDSLIGVGSALQSAAESEFAAQYNTARRPKKKAVKDPPPAAQADPAPPNLAAFPAAGPAPSPSAAAGAGAQPQPEGQVPPLETLPPTEDTIAFQPLRLRGKPEGAAVHVPSPPPVDVSRIAPLPKTPEEIASDRAVDLIAQELRMEFSPSAAPGKRRMVRAVKPAARREGAAPATPAARRDSAAPATPAARRDSAAPAMPAARREGVAPAASAARRDSAAPAALSPSGTTARSGLAAPSVTPTPSVTPVKPVTPAPSAPPVSSSMTAPSAMPAPSTTPAPSETPAPSAMPVPMQASPEKEVPAKSTVTAKEIVLEYDPVKSIREAAAESAPPQPSSLPEPERPSPELAALGPAPSAEPPALTASAPAAEAPRRQEHVFSPDPEALLALAMSRKEKEFEYSGAGQAGAVFSPDPEDLLRISREK